MKDTGEMPKVSIITVCYNCREALKATLSNILEQTYSNIELIVIDGGSVDGTLDIASKLASLGKLRFISEADRGIYDAMNKGVNLATGDYLMFMNAGDWFASTEAVAKLISYLLKHKIREPCILYGDTEFHYPQGFTRRQQPRVVQTIWQGMPFCHQSTLTSKDIFLRGPFDTSLKLAADLDFFNRALQDKVNFQYVPVTVSVFSVDGRSDKQRLQGLREEIKILRRYHQPSIRMLCFFLICRLKSITQGRIKYLLPESVVRTLLRFKYALAK